MKIEVLYQSDWCIGGESNPEENLYMEKFDGAEEGVLEAAEDMYALAYKMHFHGHYEKREVGLQEGAGLLWALNKQLYNTKFPAKDEFDSVDWLQETIFEFRDRISGERICYQHVVYGDCETTYFRVNVEE